jgi:hypothetical protein
VEAVLDKIRGIIKSNAQARAGNLIMLLNPIIRGWANYHQPVSSKQTFAQIDNALDPTRSLPQLGFQARATVDVEKKMR